MSIGIIALTNHELLAEIRSRHPHGIYSTAEFLSKIKAGNEFFTISAGESGIGGVNRYSFKLVRIEKYKGTSKQFKDADCYVAKAYYSEKKGFINDLFYGGKACFLDRNEAIAYVTELKLYENKLYGVI